MDESVEKTIHSGAAVAATVAAEGAGAATLLLKNLAPLGQPEVSRESPRKYRRR